MDTNYADQIRGYFPQTVKDLFKKDITELCPFVQTTLNDCVPGATAFNHNYAELEAYYQSIATPTPENPNPAYKIQGGGRTVKIPFSESRMRPDPSDITDFFISLARGAQFIADEYGENPAIRKIIVVQPDRYELIRGRKAANPQDNMMCYIKKYGYKPTPDAETVVLENTLMINAAFIYQSKVNWAKGIATRNEMSPQAAALGYMTQNDALTCAGIEECDHAYWLEHTDKWPEKFGITLEEYKRTISKTQQSDYTTDPLEVNATAMKAKAKKALKFTDIQLG